MKWGEVKVGDVFVTKYGEKSPEVDDVWIVLGVSPSEDGPLFVNIRYAYLHNLGDKDAVSEWNAVAESHTVEYDLLSER